VLPDVVRKVAPLAESTEIFRVVVGLVVVHVGYGEHHHSSGHWVRAIVICPAIRIPGAPFAAVLCPIEHFQADLFPVGGIFEVVDWHGYTFLKGN